ncbi:dihydroorotate dehydrogenase B catalytic subunit [archaeon 13_1_40CM_4_53_4]|nr:MAG: dihydroorotate dehydrogenase B catalytic subunit [archaeon 13_2_20CM_2_53_6]OLC62089.1 MAG: dihydroorotate dehydrogenase B catalytic subunit [archaeon 13_1_40CM_4_53_4]OLE58954.1 MAG: dihydroorotate dehydrogenase B catalytic subunit [Crenarchaeota archaeon 13_1_20CM_2_53_14]TMI24821.1 MAG: dihydroorotate dehydrogenase [Candidatus Bathyarchaeota archaeon]TMI50252.1 MAG: dihydroorotate dehydrogenase [Candidatus Bathyarchaeota archaeon]
MGPDLSVEFAGIKLPNPTILASGILGVSGEIMIRASRAGAGAVVSKSFNVKGREGYRNPSFIEVQGGFLNALGIPNPGMEEMREEVETASKAGVPVIASVFGFDAEEFAAAAAMGEKGGAIAVELNVSCPHVREVGVEIGQRPKVVAEVTHAVKGRVRIPVFVKLSPNVTDITEVAKAAQSAGADAVTAINTALGMAVNVDSAYPILGGTLGGLSGPALHPIAVRAIYQIRRAVDLPIIGVGGVQDYRGALEMMMVGASAVQIGSAVTSQGLEIFRDVTTGMSKFLEQRGLSSIRQVIGIAANRGTAES